jgi:hypothetical protein
MEIGFEDYLYSGLIVLLNGLRKSKNCFPMNMSKLLLKPMFILIEYLLLAKKKEYDERNPLFELNPQKEKLVLPRQLQIAIWVFLGINDSATNNWMISPDMVAKLTENHVSVLMQRGVGETWGFHDLNYADEGAELFDDTQSVIQTAKYIKNI